MARSVLVESSKAQVVLDKKEESVLIKNLKVIDHDIYEVISCQKEFERPEFLKRSLKVGTIVLKEALVTEKIDFVKREFERLCIELDKIFKLELGKDGLKGELDKIFSSDGSLEQCLENLFGKDGRLVRDILDMNNRNSPIGQLRDTIESYFVGKDSEIYSMLDPNSVDSPISRLRQDIVERLEKIETDIETYLTKKEIIEKTPQKGFDFEDTLEKHLLFITKPFGDTVDRVGTKKGKLDNLKGDFVIIVNDPMIKGQSLRIVVEAKSGKNVRMTLKGLIGELRDAMKNRESQYAIAVTEAMISDAIGCFREAEGDKIICTLGDNGLPLEVAYKISRVWLLMKSHESTEQVIDTARICGIIIKISNDLNMMKGIRTKLGKIESASEEIAADIRDFEKSIRESLEELQKALRSEKIAGSA